MLFNDILSDRVPTVELGQTNIIFNIPHPSLLLHIHDKTSRNAILLLIQEVKHNIIFRRRNLPPSAQQITDPRRQAAHLDSTIPRLRSYLQYIELVKQQTCCCDYENLTSPEEILTLQPCLIFLTSKTQNYLSHTNTVTCAHPAHSALQTIKTCNVMKDMYICIHPPPSNLHTLTDIM